MTLSDLGNIGEFVGAIGVIGSLIYVGYQIRQNTIATERSNARQTASDHSRALHGVMEEKVAELVLRGLNNLDDLTPVEHYRFDLAISVWLESIEQAFADYQQKSFPESLILEYKNRIPGVLDTPGGRAWWEKRQVWFSKEFRKDVDELLANPPEEMKNAKKITGT